MLIYRAIRRGTILKSLVGREPFFLVGRRQRLAEIRESCGWAYDSSLINAGSIVASFGLGEDVSFEVEISQRFGCTVYGFDPTPRSVSHTKKMGFEAQFKITDVALSNYDGKIVFRLPPASFADQVSCSAHAAYDMSEANSIRVPCMTLGSAMQSLGVRSIDLLKLDIEGAEYGVIEQSAREGWLDGVRQILVEFHHFLPGLTSQHTKDSVATLKKLGFRIGWIGKTNHEYLFLR